ncbi:MAG: UDP-N-acetylmuramoyl-L-alanyl-D-glutamate--2,6-diaminopimelate ligase [Legionellales bacterium]
MRLTDLLTSWVEPNFSDCEILGLHNDSRQIKPGDLFIAYPGVATDGRLYIDKALASGAVAVAYDPLDCPPQFLVPPSIPCVPVPQLAHHLADIANLFYANPGQFMQVTGVTGTNGKTTIAYQLAQAHQLLGQKAGYIGTIGQGDVNALKPLENTTPDALCLVTLLDGFRQEQIKQVCMEVSSHALSQGRVDAIGFNQAIFTNLTLDHLDYHHSMEHYAAAKAQLFARPELEWAILNQDDSYQQVMSKPIKKHVEKLTYGIHQDCQVRALEWQMDINGTEIEVHSPWGRHHLKTKSLGQFNIYNSLAIFSSLLASGYKPEEVVRVMSELKAAPGRLELVSESPYVLVDYAHTPDALENVLITLKQINKGNLWVVFGCGGDRDKSKRPIMGKIASLYADKIVITSDNPRSENPDCIIEEIEQGITEPNKTIKLSNRLDAITFALKNAKKYDIILIAGKGHETYQQIGAVKYPFSDRDEVFKYYLL